MNREIIAANNTANELRGVQCNLNSIEDLKKRIRAESKHVSDTLTRHKDELSRFEKVLGASNDTIVRFKVELSRFEKLLGGSQDDIVKLDQHVPRLVQRQELLKTTARRQHRSLLHLVRLGVLVPVEQREAKSAMERLEEFAPDLRPRQG